MQIVTSYFGCDTSNIHSAIKDKKCYFFSNNLEMEKNAIKKGWIFVYLPKFPQHADPLESSLQSKYVKFLQFHGEMNASIDFEKPILYVDHKMHFNKVHLKIIDSNGDRSILIRNTPKAKTSINDEITDALNQERYTRSMPQTLKWLKRKYDEGYTDKQRIMNTGLIYYSKFAQVKSLLFETYMTCLELRQPECQIIWAVLSQKFEPEIRRVNWDYLGVNIVNPNSVHQDRR